MRRPLRDLRSLASLEDLGMAYRKVKVDLFYSTRSRRRDLLDFEDDLEANLQSIRSCLGRGKAPVIPDAAWSVVPKRIDMATSSDIVQSEAKLRWGFLSTQEPKPHAQFRLMEALPISFHVFATLWINKVGHKLDAQLSDDVRGNRLRRFKSGKLNPLSLGSHPPYIHPYRKWRDDGMAATRGALELGQPVVVLTADASSFYHRIDPGFLLDKAFIKLLGVKLTVTEHALHSAFVRALKKWSQATPLHNGLPVGLTASSLVANLALYELDAKIRSELTPLYYGRYVDDIILVTLDSGEARNSAAIWDSLCDRLGGLVKKSEQPDTNGHSSAPEATYRLVAPYLGESEIEFSNSKNKTFVLSGRSGLSVLASIEEQIRERSSEWHALPDLPTEAIGIESDLLSAVQTSGESADSFRKADVVSVQRASLAIELRNVEAYSRALPPHQWKERRHAFLDALISHVLVLPSLFHFFPYVPRIIALAGVNADVKHLRRIIKALESVLVELEACGVSITGASGDTQDESIQKIRDTFHEELEALIAESIEASFLGACSSIKATTWRRHLGRDLKLLPEAEHELLGAMSERYFQRDLAHRPFKHLLMPPEVFPMPAALGDANLLSGLDGETAAGLLDQAAVASVRALCGIADIARDEALPAGLLFPTRPPNAFEMYMVHPDPFSARGRKEVTRCLRGLRGLRSETSLPTRSVKSDRPRIAIPHGSSQPAKIRVAVASWRTDERSWVAAVSQNADPDSSRLDRLFGLISAVISCREKPNYLILPECSLPANWFIAAAIRLQRKGISLIAGVEYLHPGAETVRNQMWACLSHDAFGIPSYLLYTQDKQRAAQHEEAELWRVAGKILEPSIAWTTPPIIAHGGLEFAMLCCSELTNIQYRAALRGGVDALFVPEWNRDTETFNSLVESAALDVHAYVVQCNDRQYGDSRIRAPAKNGWERDIVRVKGGIQDYFVVGSIDALALRQFQSMHRSPGGPFKPVPDGFEISSHRKVQPKP